MFCFDFLIYDLISEMLLSDFWNDYQNSIGYQNTIIRFEI